jgi:outer membrane protein OmpA-like peptidoglycan-associated protein
MAILSRPPGFEAHIHEDLMISFRQAVVTAASLFAVIVLMPASVMAEDKASTGNTTPDANKDKDNDKKHKEHRKDEGGDRHGTSGNPQGGQTSKGEKPPGDKFEKKQWTPGSGQKEFSIQPPKNGPIPFDKHTPAITTLPPKPPIVKDTAKTLPPDTFSKTQNPDDKFHAQDNNKPGFQKHFGDKDKDRAPVGKPPVVINPTLLNKSPSTGFAASPKALSPDDARKRFEDLRSARKEKVEAGGKVVIEEPGRRTIFKQNDRLVIQHDDTVRLRRVAPNARFEKGAGGTTVSIIDRPGNVKIYSETDTNGQLLRRYRRGPDGREVIIIDNRRRRHGVGKDIAIGAGIGLGVAAILDAVIDVPEPHVRIPRDKYIVDYEGASDDDVYEALSAPPIEDSSDRYTLDEIRATARLRDRMRRIDLDDINFEFGSWDVDPSEYGKLERVARGMLRVIRHNPNEVFLIEGYTDAVGSREDNLSLSDRRAESVAEVLTEQFQVPFENLTTQGYGEDYLKVPTDGPERLNRRVAVRRITPLLSRGDRPPPPPGAGGSHGDDRSDAYDGNGPDDRADANRPGPNDDNATDDRDQGGPPPDDRGGGDPAPGNGGQPYQYRPYHNTNPSN